LAELHRDMERRRLVRDQIRQIETCASLQNGSRPALSKIDAEHVAYVALRKVR
jgi:hypothetical protein